MLAILLFTAFASMNTYETATHKNLPYIDVVEPIVFKSEDGTLDSKLLASLEVQDQGYFGVPEKIKLPEASRHIEILPYESGPPVTLKGFAYHLVVAPPKKKVFGSAIIYMRTNTGSIGDIGDVILGDTINIVTNEGWQLGYNVEKIGTIEQLSLAEVNDTDKPSIIIVINNDRTGDAYGYVAYLSKVGEKV